MVLHHFSYHSVFKTKHFFDPYTTVWYKNMVHRDYYPHFTDKETWVSGRLNNLTLGPDGDSWTTFLSLVLYYMPLFPGELGINICTFKIGLPGWTWAPWAREGLLWLSQRQANSRPLDTPQYTPGEHQTWAQILLRANLNTVKSQSQAERNYWIWEQGGTVTLATDKVW